MASGATCVQRFDGSRDSAIHTTYRISLRSSSMREPRYPLPRVVQTFVVSDEHHVPSHARSRGACTRAFTFVFLGADRAGRFVAPTHPRPPSSLRRGAVNARVAGRRGGGGQSEGSTVGRANRTPLPAYPAPPEVVGVNRSQVCRSGRICTDTTMILPQVHLRKPCYDFSFL